MQATLHFQSHAYSLTLSLLLIPEARKACADAGLLRSIRLDHLYQFSRCSKASILGNQDRFFQSKNLKLYATA